MRTSTLVAAVLSGGAKPPTEFSDAFTRADGAIANDWVGATWTIASNVALNTPNLGAEGFTDGGVENWDDATHLTSWTEYADGGNSVNQDAADKHGGSFAARLQYDAGGSNAYISQAGWLQKRYYHVNYWEKAPSGKLVRVTCDQVGSDDRNMSFAGTGSWVNRIRTIRTVNIVPTIRVNKYSTFVNGTAYSFDDGSSKPLTNSELMATRPVYPTADYLLEVTIASMEIGTMAGIIFGLDDPANPQNYVVIYHNGQTLWVQKVVAGGDFQVVGSKVQAYSANDKITVAKRGTSVRVYLNDIAIAAEYTVSDATIKDNLYAGIFSTYAANTFDGWSETVKVVGGSVSFLAPFFSGEDGNIFPIGDSVTAGATDEVNGVGYPVILTDAISVASRAYWAESPARYANGGYDVLDTQAGIDVALAARSTTPTHVLILLGANDCVDTVDHWQSFDEASWKAAYQYIIDALHTKWSTAKVYLGKSYRQGAGYDVRLATLAGWIDDLVTANPGVCYAGIDTRDIYTGNEATLLTDDVHPNHAGFVAMSAAWQTLLGY